MTPAGSAPARSAPAGDPARLRLGSTPSPSLRIALNATAAVTGGGMTYWYNLLNALARLGRPHEYYVLHAPMQDGIRVELPPNFHYERIVFERPALLKRILWEQATLPGWMRREAIDVLLTPAEIAPLRSPCPVVLAIRNPTPHYGPPASTLIGRTRFRVLRMLTRLSARKAAIVFFVSDDSRRRIVASLRIPAEKTEVVYHGIGRQFLEGGPSTDPAPDPASFGARAPYLLCVSAINPHKDFATLIRGFVRFTRSSPAFADWQLLFAGPVVDAVYYKKIEAIMDELGAAASVHFCGDVPYGALPGLYRSAEVFVLPSLAETFGHPLVEAMASGVPVLATDLEVMREICGDAASYFAPASVEELASKLAELAGNPELRRSRIAAGRQRATRYSWERCATETLALLERAASIRTA